jgi:hypothetical protein
MKMFAIAATMLLNNEIKTIGFAGRDHASGGYPYFNGAGPVMFHEHSFTKVFMESVLDWGRALGTMSGGSVYFRSDSNVFLQKYREMTGTTADDVFSFQVHLLEYDFTNALDVKTKALQSVSVSGRVPHPDSKLRLPPFYNAKEHTAENLTT